MKMADLQKMTEALRRAGFVPRLTLTLPNGTTLVAEPANAWPAVFSGKSDWD